MGHGVDSEAAGWVTDYMVITNNYRTYERGRKATARANAETTGR